MICDLSLLFCFVCVLVCYDVFAADGFARNGLRPHTSPADQVLLDFSAQGITVDQLYVMLGGIEAWACRTILEHYGEWY